MDAPAAATGGAEIYRLPEECVASAISLTTPGDACHSSAVSPAFRAAADSDAVWDRFLPPDNAAVLARADEPAECESKKELFSRLCDSPVLLDGATMSFGLERRSGAKCFMMSARALSIVWGDDPTCWVWSASLPGSRFPEVAELVDVCWLEISGKLSLSLLSPGTTYAAYLVFAIADDSYGLECHVAMLPPKATVTVVSGSSSKKPTTSTEHAICLQHMQGEEEAAMHRRKQQYMRLRKGYGRKMVTREADPDIRCPRRRGDGWAEVELGEFAVAGDGEDDGVVEVRLEEVDSRRWKRGLIVQGIEIRPIPDSDAVWSRFQPRDLPPLADGELSGPAPPSEKGQFLRLCNRRVLLADGLMSMWLDRETGAKCYMISVGALHISCGGTPEYWRWTRLPESRLRFTEIANLRNVWWLEIRGRIHSKMLSQDSTYASYIVFKTYRDGGLDYPPQEASITTSAGSKSTRKVCLQRRGNEQEDGRASEPRYDRSHRHASFPNKRTDDAWMELEMGQFYNKDGDDGEVGICLMETEKGHVKTGLIVLGIEIRPKRGLDQHACSKIGG